MPDTPCHACGYDLRGTADDGACPECGEAVSRSVAIQKRRVREHEQHRFDASHITVINLIGIGFQAALPVVLAIGRNTEFGWSEGLFARVGILLLSLAAAAPILFLCNGVFAITMLVHAVRFAEGVPRRVWAALVSSLAGIGISIALAAIVVA